MMRKHLGSIGVGSFGLICLFVGVLLFLNPRGFTFNSARYSGRIYPVSADDSFLLAGAGVLFGLFNIWFAYRLWKWTKEDEVYEEIPLDQFPSFSNPVPEDTEEAAHEKRPLE